MAQQQAKNRIIALMIHCTVLLNKHQCNWCRLERKKKKKYCNL